MIYKNIYMVHAGYFFSPEVATADTLHLTSTAIARVWPRADAPTSGVDRCYERARIRRLSENDQQQASRDSVEVLLIGHQ